MQQWRKTPKHICILTFTFFPKVVTWLESSFSPRIYFFANVQVFALSDIADQSDVKYFGRQDVKLFRKTRGSPFNYVENCVSINLFSKGSVPPSNGLVRTGVGIMIVPCTSGNFICQGWKQSFFFTLMILMQKYTSESHNDTVTCVLWTQSCQLLACLLLAIVRWLYQMPNKPQIPESGGPTLLYATTVLLVTVIPCSDKVWQMSYAIRDTSVILDLLNRIACTFQRRVQDAWRRQLIVQRELAESCNLLSGFETLRGEDSSEMETFLVSRLLTIAKKAIVSRVTR